jgi:hypothetical protein
MMKEKLLAGRAQASLPERSLVFELSDAGANRLL